MRRATRGIFWAAAAVLLALGPAVVRAATVDELSRDVRRLEERNRELLDRVERLERREAPAGDAAEAGPAWTDRIRLSGGVTTVVQATAGNADNNPDGGNHADGTYTLDLGLEADLDGLGTVVVHLEGGDGEGVNDNVPSFSVPNYDAYATLNNANQADLTISEAYYEARLLGGRLTFDVGKMDVSTLFDQNAAAGDETTQFLSNIFVKSMGLTVPEPDDFYAPAAMVALAPADFLEFRLIGASANNEHGHLWEDIFSKGFVAAQAAVSAAPFGRKGTYRLYGWWDERRHVKNRLLPLVNAAPTRADQRADEPLYGWGVSLDQELADGLVLFARYSRTLDDLAAWDADAAMWAPIPVEEVYSAGLSLSGTPWNRPGDALGVAWGQALLTRDFAQSTRNPADERYVEAYYRYAWNAHLATTADLQWIENPGGSFAADNVWIFGLRGQVDF
ncbi:hypothetical protein G3N55_06340 [Dissulfurirhabdus thermomarina]|uniref:Uncharacterized protein n=1 Tax=Dissulfurirhabdus thermomarina TaxID=1765737 RepID=A0A6N9TPU2_DISTH|nr:carbohydrate porin [Dissulfurirhabdus thermomarina]NDY42460.1 hypothetical protein [Dissulfurirhabdus thermomarina]NMX23848.1 hypothetical protein [Dissulfurirhabdus thermomarina]